MRGIGAIPLVVAAAACGGKDKNKKTTPGGGGGGATAGGGTDPGAGGGSGTEPGTTEPAGGGGTSSGRPTIAPPNFDPDPAQAKAAVDMHLKVARQSLAQKTPDPDGALREAKLALDIDAASVDAMVVVAHAYVLKRLYDTAE